MFCFNWGDILKISEISKQKNNDERYNVFIDGNFLFSASMEDIIKNSLKVGMEISSDDLENIIEKCELSKAYNYALFILNRKEYTSKEIINKLNRKSFSESTINKVIDKLSVYGIIDDEGFANKYARDSVNFKKSGIKKIQYNLINKGIDQNIVRNISIDEDVQFNNALELASKKLKTIESKPNPREKIYRFLLSRGYEYDLIRKVINKLFNSCECDEL